jgi:extradiol dioxygenase family protein
LTVTDTTPTLSPFHLAIPVYDLAAARHFYAKVFNLPEGRSSDHWVDFDFFGHQLVIHEHPKTDSQAHAGTNAVDGHDVPVPHFGVVLGWEQWEALADRLQSQGVKFVIEPYVRFKGQVGEQATMFLFDPCGNALEFKAFKDIGQLFAK